MIVEFVGEPKIGKTTASIILAKGYAEKLSDDKNIYKYAVIDTTPGLESYPVLLKVEGEEVGIFMKLKNVIGSGFYYNALSMADIKGYVRRIVNDKKFKAAVIDSSDYLLEMAVKEYLTETGHKSVYPPTEWRIVREKVVSVFRELMSREDLLIVFTSPVKDEYQEVMVEGKNGVESKSVKTGRKVPAGFDKLSYIVDARIGIGFDNKRGRYYKVMLSRFFDVITAPTESIKYYGNDISFDLLVKLMFGKLNNKEVKK